MVKIEDKYEVVGKLPEGAMPVSEYTASKGWKGGDTYLYRLIRLKKNKDFKIVRYMGRNFVVPVGANVQPNIIMPIHMQEALDKALNSFSEDGFLYTITYREAKGNHIYLYIDANDQQLFNLAIKVGYNLFVEKGTP